MNKRYERRNSRRVESCADEDKLRYRILQGKNINDYTQRAKKNEAGNKDVCNVRRLISVFFRTRRPDVKIFTHCLANNLSVYICRSKKC